MGGYTDPLADLVYLFEPFGAVVCMIDLDIVQTNINRLHIIWIHYTFLKSFRTVVTKIPP